VARCLPRNRLHGPAVAATVFVLAWLAPAPTPADDLPEGMPVGRWFLAPRINSSFESNDNIFFSDEARAESDQVTTYGGGILATLPFRDNRLELDYQADRTQYRDFEFPRDVTQVAKVDLELNFRSGDTLSLRDVYRRDFARAKVIDPDTGVELEAVDGEPYNINRWEIELSRDDLRRQGYLVRVRRQDFMYKGEEDIGFFEYRGFHTVCEYRQPLPENRGWVMRYTARRFNHYEPFGETGVPFRKEKSDAVLLGVVGLLGEGQPFRVNLGYGRFRYEGTDESEFDGLVGLAAWRLRLGGRTRIDLEAVRRPLPSNSETYYINNAVRADIQREWLHYESGAEIELGRNDYSEVTAEFGPCDGKRRDTTYQAEAYLGWRVHERLRFRVSSFHTSRSSTCVLSGYEATGIESSVTFGWF
jgi:hypothetical protein